ncbi:MAG: hypothetical protein HFJ50_09805 [Clostridia bacterium]|nr:hypothetical protein [Clostridia bacterium]
MKEIIIIGNQLTSSDGIVADKNLIKALAEFYGNQINENTSDFENFLIHYFKDNYLELIQDNDEKFLFKFSNKADDNSISYENGDLFKIAEQFDIDSSVFDNNFGANLVVKDGLIYENTDNGLNVIYATDKALNSIINDLYGKALYHSHLSKQNALQSNLAVNLQNGFIEFAKNKGVELSSIPNIKLGKRFIKKKNSSNNVISFKQESC